jgi:hypothetical protein
MNKLTESQFRNALRKGLGRAVLHVRHFGAAGLEDAIIDACVHSMVYAVCEGTRGEWLHEIVGLAGLSAAVMPKVVDGLLQPSTRETFWDVAQLYSLAATFAEEGYPEARNALYQKFDRREFSESWLGGIQTLAVDGLPGFLHVAEVIGERFRNEPEYWEDDYLISEAYERLGREIVRDAMIARSRDSEHIRSYLENVDRIEQQEAERKTEKQEPSKPVDAVLEEIETVQGKYPHRLQFWGRQASDQDIAVIFDHMAMETRPEQLRRYLYVFGMREIPCLRPQILELANSDDERLRCALMRALGHTHSPTVRNLGLRMFKHVPPRLEAIRLLARNYEPGDGALLESLLPTAGDLDMLHGIGLDLLEITAETKDSEFTNSLLWLYEHGPCSMCRENAVQYLVEMKTAPEELLAECLWDCNDDTRKLAMQAGPT